MIGLHISEFDRSSSSSRPVSVSASAAFAFAFDYCSDHYYRRLIISVLLVSVFSFQTLKASVFSCYSF